MLNNIIDFIKIILMVFGIILILIFGIFFLYCGIALIDSYVNKTICKVYVENKLVHTGYCHYITIHSIGENGNTKHVSIYKDKILLKPILNFINNDVRIEGKEIDY